MLSFSISYLISRPAGQFPNEISNLVRLGTHNNIDKLLLTVHWQSNPYFCCPIKQFREVFEIFLAPLSNPSEQRYVQNHGDYESPKTINSESVV